MNAHLKIMIAVVASAVVLVAFVLIMMLAVEVDRLALKIEANHLMITALCLEEKE